MRDIFTRPAADRRVWSTFEEFCLFVCVCVCLSHPFSPWKVSKQCDLTYLCTSLCTLVRIHTGVMGVAVFLPPLLEAGGGRQGVGEQLEGANWAMQAWPDLL